MWIDRDATASSKQQKNNVDRNYRMARRHVAMQQRKVAGEKENLKVVLEQQQ